MPIINQIIIDALQLAQEKQRIYEAIKRKRGIDFPYNPLSGYSDAIDKITTRGIPTMIANMPFEVGDEPTTGNMFYVRPGGSGVKDGSSWDNAFESRQDAVAVADVGDRIYVMEGTYRLTSIQRPALGVSEYYGFPRANPSWETRQPFLHPSKLDAAFTDNNYQNTLFAFTPGQVIDGLWIENVITYNDTAGIYATYSTLVNCITTNCISFTNLSAGGVFIGGGIMTNCIVTNCNSSNFGGIDAGGSTITNCVITNCNGSNAGGVHLATSTMINCIITNCSSAYNPGTGRAGGVSTYNSTITNCIIANCSSSYESSYTGGGGAYLINTAMTNCIVTNCNSSKVGYSIRAGGGGIYVESGGTIINCVITNCSSDNFGGGILSNMGGNKPGIVNNTIINCSAPIGSGVCLYASKYAYNNIVWNCNIHLEVANYAYEHYNNASNFPISFATNAANSANIQNFIELLSTLFPFKKQGSLPFNNNGVFFINLPKNDASSFFINSEIIPKMTDAHLPADSPLIEAGYYESGVTLDTDADGNERPYPPSIGAYEYVEE